jgi:alkaline phosphatase D
MLLRKVQFNDAQVPTRDGARRRRTILGAEQKAWFKDKLKSSTATWKIWGNSLGRAGLARRPAEPARGSHQGVMALQHVRNLGWRGLWHRIGRARGNLPSRARRENHRLRHRSRAIVTASGPDMRLRNFRPASSSRIGVSFVGASLASPGVMEAYEHRLPKDAPLRPLFLADKEAGSKPDWTFNMLLKARRPCVLRICKELRPEARPVAVQPGSGSAPRVRRSWRTRLCEGPNLGR